MSEYCQSLISWAQHYVNITIYLAFHMSKILNLSRNRFMLIIEKSDRVKCLLDIRKSLLVAKG